MEIMTSNEAYKIGTLIEKCHDLLASLKVDSFCATIGRLEIKIENLKDDSEEDVIATPEKITGNDEKVF